MHRLQLQRGFVCANGVKICKLRGPNLIFHDKNRQRSQRRGTSDVSIPIRDLVEFVEKTGNRSG